MNDECWFCAQRSCRLVDGVRVCPCPHHFGGEMPPLMMAQPSDALFVDHRERQSRRARLVTWWRAVMAYEARDAA